MGKTRKLNVIVEVMTNSGDFVELFDQDFVEEQARAMMAAAMADEQALDFDETEGNINVSLYNDGSEKDDLDSSETDFVQFPHDFAVEALHLHFGWDRSFLFEALSIRRIRRLMEEHKNLRVPANSRHHEYFYDLMSSLDSVDLIDKGYFN